jgi:hypothetical protein
MKIGAHQNMTKEIAKWIDEAKAKGHFKKS